MSTETTTAGDDAPLRRGLEGASKGMPNPLPNPYMRGTEDQITIQFSQLEAEKFRSWQREQRFAASRPVEGEATARVPLSPADKEAFRRWQQEQLQRQREREAAEREPWESDPDAWKAGGE